MTIHVERHQVVRSLKSHSKILFIIEPLANGLLAAFFSLLKSKLKNHGNIS